MGKNKNLSLETQLQIVEDYKNVKSAEKLSSKYEISANSIRNILHKQTIFFNIINSLKNLIIIKLL